LPITVAQNGVITAEIDAPMSPTAPAFLTTDRSAFGDVAAINEDGSVNSPGNPIAPGKVATIFMTGLGQIVPPVPTAGMVANAAGSVATKLDLWVALDVADILYAGPAPGLLIGVYQVNFRVPASGYAGWVNLSLTALDLPIQMAANSAPGIYVSCPVGATCQALSN
jgi:uncharacterized protein (TIGR03437 family)